MHTHMQVRRICLSLTATHRREPHIYRCNHTLKHSHAYTQRSFKEAADLVTEHSVDGETLLSLTAQELEADLKIPKLKAKRLMKEIKMENYWVFS